MNLPFFCAEITLCISLTWAASPCQWTFGFRQGCSTAGVCTLSYHGLLSSHWSCSVLSSSLLHLLSEPPSGLALFRLSLPPWDQQAWRQGPLKPPGPTFTLQIYSPEPRAPGLCPSPHTSLLCPHTCMFLEPRGLLHFTVSNEMGLAL